MRLGAVEATGCQSGGKGRGALIGNVQARPVRGHVRPRWIRASSLPPIAAAGRQLHQPQERLVGLLQRGRRAVRRQPADRQRPAPSGAAPADSHHLRPKCAYARCVRSSARCMWWCARGWPALSVVALAHCCSSSVVSGLGQWGWVTSRAKPEPASLSPKAPRLPTCRRPRDRQRRALQRVSVDGAGRRRPAASRQH